VLSPARVSQMLDDAVVAVRAQQSQAAVFTQFQDVFALFVDQVVFAVAEESEVALVKPVQEILRLAQLGDLRRDAPPYPGARAICNAFWRILGQSSTAARTSLSTLCRPSRSEALASSETRLISTAIHDSI
jgi:hypothetical protein